MSIMIKTRVKDFVTYRTENEEEIAENHALADSKKIEESVKLFDTTRIHQLNEENSAINRINTHL